MALLTHLLEDGINRYLPPNQQVYEMLTPAHLCYIIDIFNSTLNNFDRHHLQTFINASEKWIPMIITDVISNSSLTVFWLKRTSARSHWLITFNGTSHKAVRDSINITVVPQLHQHAPATASWALLGNIDHIKREGSKASTSTSKTVKSTVKKVILPPAPDHHHDDLAAGPSTVNPKKTSHKRSRSPRTTDSSRKERRSPQDARAIIVHRKDLH